MHPSFRVLTVCLALFSSPLFAQQNLGEILESTPNFYDSVAAGEAYFRAKQPGVSPGTLLAGPERDGEYVKFMRWQNYWKHALNPDGTRGDISAHGRAKLQQVAGGKGASGLYQSINWTNLSYENYIVSQIGMGRTTSMAFHPSNPDIFYVGAAIGGIWKTTDGGQSYVPLGDELPFMAVSSIIVNQDKPNNIYIAVSDHIWYGPPGIGVYKSINYGETWQNTSLSFDFSDDIRIYWMAADPNNPAKMLVASSDGLYKTENYFISVTKVNSVSSFDVKFHPGNSNIVYQGGQNGEFLRSVDGGASFTQIKNFESGNVYIATTSMNTSKVYVRNNSTLHKSTNSGASFSAQTNILPEGNSVLAFSQNDQNTLLAGNFETQRSDDDGASFYATSQWLGNDNLALVHVDQRNIFFNPLEPDYVYYCNDGGVYRYVISTDTFENLSDGLMITQFYDIAVSQTDINVISGGSQDNGNVFRDTNGVWDDFAPTGDGMTQEIDPTDANTRYWAYQHGELNRWVNGVNTGIKPPGTAEGAWETPFRLDPQNPSRLIAGYFTVWESLDKGDNWADIGGGTNFGGNLEEIAISKSNPNRIYAARGSQLFVKNTFDNQWVTKSLPDVSISDLEVDPDNLNIIYVTVPGFISGSKVYKSLNAGTNWINISDSLPNVSVGAIEIYETIPGGLFIGTDAGVFYNDPALPTWQEYGDLPNTRVEDIEIQYAAKKVRIGTHGRGVLEAPISIAPCAFGDPDADNDGICNTYDACPALDNGLLGTLCDDDDPLTSGEFYGNDCNCGGGTPVALYCDAAGSAGTGGDWIERVSLNTLDKNSGYSSYSNFKNESTTLAAGGAYPLNVDLFQSFDLDKVHAWVDTDRDGVFETAERIAMSDLDGNNRSTGLFNVPGDIGLTTTVLRVRSIYADPNPSEACGNYFGEVEDYTLRFGYCDAQGQFGTGSDWIKNVKLNTIDFASTQTFYSDFREQSTDLNRGSSYPIEVSLNYAFPINQAFTWIDFDKDGQFEDEERTNLSAFTTGFNATAEGVVTVPEDALPGKTVMRVRSQYSEGSNGTACGTGFAGEVEDYEINIGYCAAGGTANTGDDWIRQVSLNSINHASGKSIYSDFSEISTDLIRGASYPVDVKLNYAFDIDHVDVWVDFDKDGDFEEAERTVMSDPAVGWNGVASGVIAVPESAIQGETTMRVRAIYSGDDLVNSCGNYYGEVEDYTVNLSYCAASGAAGTTADWISNVKLNTINNASEQAAYSNFKDQSTTLYSGESYELETAINYAFDLDQVHAWLDYNHDGSFTTDERIAMSDLAVGFNSISNGTITVPPGTPLGETTLRVRVIYADMDLPDPCNSHFGEVEDYTIIFGGEPPPDELFKDGFE